MCVCVCVWLLANTPAQTETLLLNLEGAAVGIGLHDKTEYMCFNHVASSH